MLVDSELTVTSKCSVVDGDSSKEGLSGQVSYFLAPWSGLLPLSFGTCHVTCILSIL